MIWVDLISFNNWVRDAETLTVNSVSVTYPLTFDRSLGNKLNVANDGLVLTPSYATLGNTQQANAGLAGAADTGAILKAEWYQ